MHLINWNLRHTLISVTVKYFFKKWPTQLWGWRCSSILCNSANIYLGFLMTPCLWTGTDQRESQPERANETAVCASHICAKCLKSQSLRWSILANWRTAFNRSALSPVWAIFNSRQATEFLNVFHHFPIGWIITFIQF